MILFILLGPVVIIYCVYRAARETRIRRIEKAPPWLVTSIMNTNGPERKWGLK